MHLHLTETIFSCLHFFKFSAIQATFVYGRKSNGRKHEKTYNQIQ